MHVTYGRTSVYSLIRNTFVESAQNLTPEKSSPRRVQSLARVSTTCWRRWASLRWSNDARLVDLMLYKIQSGLAHCPTLKAKLVPLPSRQRRTHDKQLTLLTTRTQYRGSSFHHQGLELVTHKISGGPHP